MKREQILVVEDDPWLAEQYQRVLEKAEYEVRLAPHAIAAIDMIDEALPDVIILDVLLTGPNGFTLLHELRSYPDLSTVPVILCSNTIEHLSLDDLKPYGIREILNKATMQPDDLQKAIKRVRL